MGKDKRYTEYYKEMIVDIYKWGITLAEISSECGIAKSIIKGWVKDWKEIKINDEETITLKEVKDLKKGYNDSIIWIYWQWDK